MKHEFCFIKYLISKFILIKRPQWLLYTTVITNFKKHIYSQTRWILKRWQKYEFSFFFKWRNVNVTKETKKMYKWVFSLKSSSKFTSVSLCWFSLHFSCLSHLGYYEFYIWSRILGGFRVQNLIKLIRVLSELINESSGSLKLE